MADSGSRGGHVTSAGGPIGFMARNGVAANVLMLFLLLAGLGAASNLVQEVLPDFSLERVQIVVPYPGAAPQEVEESIVRRIEEEIRAVDGLQRIESTAAEGLGTVVVEFRSGTDINRALNDVKAQVDRIPSFPAGAERPEVREITSRQSVIRLLVHGDVPERTLKELAYGIEEGISSLPEVSLAETSGARMYEISIEVPLRHLRALGLTLDDVAFAVRQGSLELSAGMVSTANEEVLVRTLGQNYDQADFEDIVVLTRPDGTAVRLGEIATVRDGFADSDLSVRYNGQPAVRVDVFRTSEEQVLDIARVVNDYLEAEVVPSLPEGTGIAIWKDDSEEVGGRLGLMIENALLGLALVFLCLALFLEIRLAVWVAVGLAVAFTGTFLVMGLLGISINMFSLMALVLALGIVVDDAIVVGESVFTERERGARGVTAAIRGARLVSGPVIFSVLTTVTAFAALLPAPGPQGKLGRSIPIVVIVVLFLSLVESLLVLPNHLSHLKDATENARNRLTRLLRRVQRTTDALLKRITDGPLDRGLRFAVDQPLVVVASSTALLVLSGAVVASGIVPNQFLTPIEGEVVSANVEMPAGTPGERTAEVLGELEAAGRRAVGRLEEDQARDGGPLLFDVAVTVGEPATLYDPLAGDETRAPRGHVGAVQFKLTGWEEHDIAASTFERVWREEAGTFPGAESVSISSNLLGLGLPVHFELSHPDAERLAVAADAFTTEVAALDGVFDVRNNLDEGYRELQLELEPGARTLNLTLDSFAGQVRSAVFGSEALRVQRGREDMRVYVRLPEDERNSPADIEHYLVRTPGGELPLAQVASARFARSAATVHRVDGRRAVTVTADIDPRLTSAAQANRSVDVDLLPRLMDEHPGLEHTIGGLRKDQEHAYTVLSRSLFLALLLMYALMAIPFGSYSQPLIVMAAVPLGAVGALAGHMLLGLSWGLWSLYGLIGVFGVVVNDSLIMIKSINDLRDSGMSPRDAIVAGGKGRFRPILLTSLTTFLGVSPIVFESSTYAQHLVPLATSVGFGVLIATFLLMLVVPALAMLNYSVTGWIGERRARAALPR